MASKYPEHNPKEGRQIVNLKRKGYKQTLKAEIIRL